MFNSKFISQTIAIALVALASASSVSAVCGLGGEVGFGNTANGGSVIVANDCGVIDSKSGSICGGGYAQGSHVICDNSANVVSAQTPDGHDWGKCISSNEKCGSTQIRFCCS